MKKTSVTLGQRIKTEVGLGFVGNTYPISYEYELKEFVDPYPALTVEINGKQVVFSNYPYQNVVQTRSYGGLCGSITSKEITLSASRLAGAHSLLNRDAINQAAAAALIAKVDTTALVPDS